VLVRACHAGAVAAAHQHLQLLLLAIKAMMVLAAWQPLLVVSVPG
jgi:hypothetical protein